MFDDFLRLGQLHDETRSEAIRRTSQVERLNAAALASRIRLVLTYPEAAQEKRKRAPSAFVTRGNRVGRSCNKWVSRIGW